MSNNVLLVWELIPEQSKIYRLIDLDEETFAKLLKCHGHIGGVANPDPEIDSIICDWLCDWLVDKQEWIVSELDGKAYHMPEWLDDFRLVHTGFAL